MRNAESGGGSTPEPPHSALAHYLSIYAMLWRNSIVREMGFKLNFLLWIIVELLWFGLQLAFFSVIYLHTDRIHDWSKWQVVMLIGTSHFIQQIFTAIFLTNMTELSELVRTGRLDFLLLLPVNTRFLVSLRKVDWGAFINAATALAVIAYAAVQLHFTPSVAQAAAYLALCFVGITIHYSLMFALASISFWAVRAQGIVWGYYNLFQIARLPDSAFRGVFRAVFTFALPMLLVSNLPVRVLVDKLASPWQLALLVGMALGCAVFSEAVWRISVRRYTSASS
jgi:ABC-2 type transport system permease protein